MGAGSTSDKHDNTNIDYILEYFKLRESFEEYKTEQDLKIKELEKEYMVLKKDFILLVSTLLHLYQFVEVSGKSTMSHTNTHLLFLRIDKKKYLLFTDVPRLLKLIRNWYTDGSFVLPMGRIFHHSELKCLLKIQKNEKYFHAIN